MTAPPAPAAILWRYHFTDFRTGRLLATLPLRDVKLEQILGGPADASGTVPLAAAVMDRDPFAATVVRKTCLWAERQVLDPATGRAAFSTVEWGGIVMKRVRSHAARTLALSCVSWEAYLKRRLTPDLSYQQADKFTIMRELVAAAVPQPPVPGPDAAAYPVIPPHLEPLTDTSGPLSGVAADRTYRASDLKPVLSSCTELADSGGGFDWRLIPYMDTPGDLTTFRVRLALGHPRLGRIEPPDLRWSTDEGDSYDRWGHIADLSVAEDGSGVHNRVTALGEGSGPDQLRSVADSTGTSRDEVASGYPLYETSLGSSTNDLRTQDSVDGYAVGALLAQLGSELQVSGIAVRGDLTPTLDTYTVGDDAAVRIVDTSSGQAVTVIGQCIGRSITPPGPGSTEQVALDVQGSVTA